MKTRCRFLMALLFALCFGYVFRVAGDEPGVAGRREPESPADGWRRHTIDQSSRGADGVRPADVNGDGHLDLVTGWEEGGQIRVCLNPGPRRAQEIWPSVTVGRVRSPEDAVFADLDCDGAMDVASSCEGGTRAMFVHWGPKDPEQRLSAEAWTTERLPASDGRMMWMYCRPLDVDGRNGIDLVAAGKGHGAAVGWFESPSHPRTLGDWTFHPLCDAGWIMSLEAHDIDGDGDRDIIFSDRKGKARGCYWLENPGDAEAQRRPWTKHAIGGLGEEVMFLAVGDLDGDDRTDVVTGIHSGDLLFLKRTAGSSPTWEPHRIRRPEGTGWPKGIAIGDLDLDGRADLVVTCEGAAGKSGAFWLSRPPGTPATAADWTFHEISGTKHGVKFDRIELIDLDADGDLDVVTCEERDNLGVVWYENPTRECLSVRTVHHP